MAGRYFVDLRSDTITRPTDAMRRAMAAAEVGDDVYGEDPTVNRLEEHVAGLAGKEAALFVPSGSMANLIAQMIHVEPGEEILLGEGSHATVYEVGAGPALAGVQYDVIAGRHLLVPDDVRTRVKRRTLHTPGTALVWIENTHNVAGGRVYPLERLDDVASTCREAGVPLHMDGARVFNAAVAARCPLARVVRDVDSFSFCLSKGLGAPVGSVLVGTRAFHDRALRLRKRLGGGMRQAGVLAAAGLHALEHHVERLVEDHQNARRLAERLAGCPGLSVDPADVETNIVVVTVAGDAAARPAQRLAAAAQDDGVRIDALDAARLRLVTHLDAPWALIERAAAVVERHAPAA